MINSVFMCMMLIRTASPVRTGPGGHARTV